MARVIIDDLSSEFTYGGGSWSAVAASHFYGGSATWPDFARGTSGDTGVYGSLTFSFQGTSVTFFGNTPPANDTQWSLFSIDGSPAYNSSFMDPSPPSSRQWYQSPVLPDAQHNITITHIPSTSVDFVVVTAGQNTPLLGQTLIVDDTDAAIAYEGSWTQNPATFATSYDPFTGLPFGNSTHQTSSTGASAVFRFSGTGVTVAGIFSYDLLGWLAVNYTLDGFSSLKNYSVTSTTTEFTQGMKQTENFIFFTSGSLTSGNHTLLMQVTDCVNQIFEIDYFTYNPSFATLASKPSLPLTSSSQSSSTSTSISTTVTSQRSKTSNSTSTAAIAGGVVGGVVFILLILLLLYRKRVLKKHTETSTMQTASASRPLTLDPFIGPPSASERRGSHQLDAMTQTEKSGTFRGQNPTSSISNQVTPSAPMVLSPQPSTSSAGENNRLVSRIHRLQTLFSDLSRESAAAGGEASNNPRVAEVRGRIAELVRDENENSSHGGTDGSAVFPAREMGNIPPPAYEPV